MKHVSSFLGLAAAVSMAFAPIASQAATTGAFSAGDLIKGTQTTTVYYFGPDGHRYVFPNDKTYFTWYSDFSKVKTIPDSMLSAIPLGRSNVTYRPGYKMLKITTDPKVYVVDQGGVLRAIPSEQLAQTLYGLNWKNRIDDVADSFFVNYRVGTPLLSASDFKPNDVETATPDISTDKQFDNTMTTITISNASNGYVPSTTTIKVGHSVTWTNADIVPHSITSGSFNSNQLAPNQTYSHLFNSVGSFDYKDGAYPVMKGTVNVVQ